MVQAERERERGKEGGGGWDPVRESFWLVWVGPVPTHTVLPRIQVHIKSTLRVANDYSLSVGKPGRIGTEEGFDGPRVFSSLAHAYRSTIAR